MKGEVERDRGYEEDEGDDERDWDGGMESVEDVDDEEATLRTVLEVERFGTGESSGEGDDDEDATGFCWSLSICCC